jgi:hypothetical protein
MAQAGTAFQTLGAAVHPRSDAADVDEVICAALTLTSMK